jgi:hypothetical protein
MTILLLKRLSFSRLLSSQRRLQDAMIINLNQFRKKRRRIEAETQAKENRVRFGRTKEERTAELRERERAKKEIENKRLD